MPFGAETYVRSRFLMPVAVAALALVLSSGLAGCGGGGGSGVGGEVMIMPGPSGPDLVVESPSVSDPAPSAGAGFTLSVSVRNAGERSAAATTLRFYRSEDAAITPLDEEVDSADVAELAGAESASASVELTAPSPPGTYYYGACVAAVAGESDVANNCSSSVGVAAPAPRTPAPAPQQRTLPPDLVVTSPAPSPASPAAGGVFRLYANLRNAGGRDAEGITVRFYRSADKTITTSDTQVAARALRNQPARTSNRVFSGEIDVPALGTYYYGACVDAVAGESDTANNCSEAVTVSVTHNKPNLGIIVSSAVNLRVGLLPVAATVRNFGGPSPPTRVVFYHSTDKTITPDDTPLLVDSKPASVPVPALPKSEPKTFWSQQFSTGWLRVPGPTTPGKHYYGACVIAVPDESNTTDNCRRIYTLCVYPDADESNAPFPEWDSAYKCNPIDYLGK